MDQCENSKRKHQNLILVFFITSKIIESWVNLDYVMLGRSALALDSIDLKLVFCARKYSHLSIYLF